MTSRYSVGVDVGGTFTDVMALDLDSGAFSVVKVPTTTGNQSQGFMRGLAALGVPLSSIQSIVHGTTVGTNALLERRGAPCGLITTIGFRDSLELGRRTRPRLYGLEGTFEPLIPRDRRIEVPERIDSRGNVIIPLDERAVREAAERLRDAGAIAIVIHFLHSYRNPAHEQRAKEIVRSVWPNDYVTIGSEILREIREFERGSTAAVNAYVQPIVERYVAALRQALASEGFARELLIMQSNGGMMAASVTREHAVQTVLSGPAGGAIGTARVAGAAGIANVIGCDMGGTSFDVCVIRDGVPQVSVEKDIAYGIPVRVPMIDIHTIGAGGGSIARVNAGGLLQVGPESAGARPGPICYGRGGREPTVTDAHLLLGHIDVRALAAVEGGVPLDHIRAVFEERLAGALGLDAEGAARAVIDVANAQMANAIRLVSVEQGHDPRDFTLFPYGGAGPLHAVDLARQLGIPSILVPRYPGITSALGCILADVRHDFVRNVDAPIDRVDPAAMDAIFAEQREAGAALIAREGVDVASVEAVHEVDMLFAGQTHLFRFATRSPGFNPAAVRETFVRLYRGRFDIDLPEMRAVAVNLRTTVFGRRTQPDLAALGATGRRVSEAPRRRRVCFGADWIDTPIVSRESMRPGDTLDGPAVVEQLDTTVLLPPGCRARTDGFGNLLVNVE